MTEEAREFPGFWLERVRAAREESCRVKQSFTPALDAAVCRAAAAIRAALSSGRRVFAFGNGGSASDAQHFVAELVGRYQAERAALPALAFTANTSDLTAIGNDYGFDKVFARQVEAWVGPGDAVIAISTSGNSRNVLLAAEEARRRSASVIALTGRDGGKLASCCDLEVRIPSSTTARIQESHILVLHTIAELVEST
jgi:phosphoheptose isomerase